jgi:hypothetical protein
MVDERIALLVTKLHQNTLSRKISWAPTVDDNAFEATFPRYTVRISEREGRTSIQYVISILNDLGVSVDSFSDSELSARFADAPLDLGWYGVLREIYEMARRQALGADQAIDDILGELG